MSNVNDIYGMIIGFVAVGGGLGIGMYAVYISTTTDNQRKMAAEQNRHKERMALIEKGLDPLIADKKAPRDFTQGAFLWGMLLGGVGVGALIGHAINPLADKNDLTANALALLFGGLGLLGFYVARKKPVDKHPS